MTWAEDFGYRVGEWHPFTAPAVIVLMGGLAMPNVPVTVEDVDSLLSRYPDADHIGICFMHMFAQAGWIGKVSIALLIDADIQIETTIRDSS